VSSIETPIAPIPHLDAGAQRHRADCVGVRRIDSTFVLGKMRGQFHVETADGEEEAPQVFSDTWVGWEGPCNEPK